MQPTGSMSEEVAMLMDRAALNRDFGPQCSKGFLEAGRAVDDGEFRRLQATFDKVIESVRQAASLSPRSVASRKPNSATRFCAALRDNDRPWWSP
jgi:hypothetical protein